MSSFRDRHNKPEPEHRASPAAPRNRVPIETRGVTRRVFIQSAAGPFVAAALSYLARGPGQGLALGRQAFLAPQASCQPSSTTKDTGQTFTPESLVELASSPYSMGIVETSLTPVIRPTARDQGSASRRPGWDALELLEKCHQLGASGIQTQLNSNPTTLRNRGEQLGMWLEGMVSVPRNGDTAAFEQEILRAKAAGAAVVRTAMLGGRRYESFGTLEDWKNWVDQSHRALALVIPIMDRLKVTLAVENHKDWTLEEMQKLLKTYESEYLGVCFDFGNNIALLDDPMEMVTVLAPYVKATHVKDMAVRAYRDGFLLSEVPLGTGLLDLPRMVRKLRQGNPMVHLALEMITRDPLKVPCLTPEYWTVFPERNGNYLARTLKLVQKYSAAPPLPTVSHLAPVERVRVEEENVKSCLAYARDKLAAAPKMARSASFSLVDRSRRQV